MIAGLIVLTPESFSQTNRVLLDNGACVLVRDVKDTGLVSVYVKVHAGLSTEHEYAGSGITHFIEHMIFKGPKGHPVGTLPGTIKSYGGFVNATTSVDSTTFFVTVPKEYASQSVRLLIDAVMNPVFTPKDVEKERSVILNEVRLREDEPTSLLSKILFEDAYLYHPYRYPIIGYRDLLEKLTPEDLVSYHTRFYVPNNMVVSIVGDLNGDSIIKNVEDALKDYPRARDPQSAVLSEPEQVTARQRIKKADINMGYFAIGYHSTGVMDRDLFVMDILASVLGEGDGARLNTRLVKKDKLLYSVNCYNFTPVYPGLFVVTGIGQPDNIDKAIKVVFEEIENLKRDGILGDEFEKIKKKALSTYYSTLETVSTQAGIMAEGEMFAGDADFMKNYVDHIRNASVDDVNAACSKYLNKSNSTTAILMPEAWNGSMGQDTKAEAEKADAPEVFTLDNGLRVIVNREAKIPMVSIVVLGEGGVLNEPEGLGGIASITNRLLLKGTTSRDEAHIVPEIENLGGTMNSFSSSYTFGLTCSVMPGDMKFALDLLEDVVKNPVFDEAWLEKIKTKNMDEIALMDDDIFDTGVYNLKKGIFGAHPYGRRLIGSRESIAAITRSDVEAYYKNCIDPGRMVLSVTGDVNVKDTLGLIKERFGDIRSEASKPFPEWKAPVLEKAEEVTLRMPKKEALFLIGFTGVDINDPDRYVLDVLFKIMSGSDGRLFNSIREAFGISYTQGGTYVAGVGAGYCLFYVATDPAGLARSKSVCLSQIEDLRKDLVSDKELQDAKNSVIGRWMMSLQTYDAIAITMASDELFLSGFLEYKVFPDKVRAVTKEDIRRVARKYLDPDRSYEVVVLPEDN